MVFSRAIWLCNTPNSQNDLCPNFVQCTQSLKFISCSVSFYKYKFSPILRNYFLEGKITFIIIHVTISPWRSFQADDSLNFVKFKKKFFVTCLSKVTGIYLSREMCGIHCRSESFEWIFPGNCVELSVDLNHINTFSPGKYIELTVDLSC